MRLLPQPGEHHRHAGILADGQAQLIRSVQILLQIPHDVPGQRHTFPAGRFLDRAADIPRQMPVGLNTQIPHRLFNGGGGNIPQGDPS